MNEKEILDIQEKELKTIVFDLDDTLCNGNKVKDSHYYKKPNTKVIDILNSLHDKGFKIVIETSRGMGTCGNDESITIMKHGEDTLRWLRENNVHYDAIKFGKTYAKMYVDDKAIRPSELINLGLNKCLDIVKNEKMLIQNIQEKEI